MEKELIGKRIKKVRVNYRDYYIFSERNIFSF